MICLAAAKHTEQPTLGTKKLHLPVFRIYSQEETLQLFSFSSHIYFFQDSKIQFYRKQIIWESRLPGLPAAWPWTNSLISPRLNSSSVKWGGTTDLIVLRRWSQTMQETVSRRVSAKAIRVNPHPPINRLSQCDSAKTSTFSLTAYNISSPRGQLQSSF